MGKYTKTEKKVVDVLNDLINKEGYDYIYDNAWDVYNILLEKKIDKKMASLLLYALVLGLARENRYDIRGDVWRVLSLNKEMSASICNIFSSLYNNPSPSDIEMKAYQGLEEFCSKEWEMCPSAEGTSEDKYGFYTDYAIRYYLTVKVVDRASVERGIRSKLKKNPFMQAEDIVSYYESKASAVIAPMVEACCSTSEGRLLLSMEEYISRNCVHEMDDYFEYRGLKVLSRDYEYYESDFY